MKLSKILSLFVVFALIVCVSSCGNTATTSVAEGVGDPFDEDVGYDANNEQEEIEEKDNEYKEITFKEAVESSPIWFYGDYKIAKDTCPSLVVVFQNGAVKIYGVDSYMYTFGDYASMSDDEIITYLETNCGEDDIYEFENYSFEILTDDTGNFVIGELVHATEQSNGGLMPYDSFPDYGFQYGEVYHSIASQQIYDALYQGFFCYTTDSDHHYPWYFVTRSENNTVFSYDQIGADGITVS